MIAFTFSLPQLRTVWDDHCRRCAAIAKVWHFGIYNPTVFSRALTPLLITLTRGFDNTHEWSRTALRTLL